MKLNNLIKIKGKRFRIAAGILLMIAVVSMILFVLSSFEFPFTGFFAFKPSVNEYGKKVFNEEPNSNGSLQDAPKKILNDSVIRSGNVSSNTSVVNRPGRFSGSGSGGGGGGGPDVVKKEGYHLSGLSKELSLWLNGAFLNPNELLKGYLRFSLYLDPYKVAEFDLNVSRNINLSMIRANTSFYEGKSFFYSDDELIQNIGLFVPRIPGNNKVRICKNVSSLDKVHEGCQDEGATAEYTLSIGEPGISLSEDGAYFIVENTSFSGGISEGVKEASRNLSILLISPAENSGDEGKEIIFSYEITGQSADRCSLVIDDRVVGEKSNVSLGVNSFTAFNLTKGKHFWGIVCEAALHNSISSLKRRITAIPLRGKFEFPGNLNKMDIERVANFSLNRKGFGLINFLGEINLTDAENMSDYVIIDKNFISINSEKFPELNKPAVVTFYGLDFKNPVILRDGKTCSDCQIMGNDDGLVFQVNHFSNYSASENSALLIWDRTVGGSLVFYANYTKVIDNSAIEGAVCNVDFGDGNHQMNYAGGLYVNDSSFSGEGTATVNCSADGYTEIILTDYFNLNPGTRVNGAKVTPGISQAAPTDEPESHSALAGNITQMNLFGYTITQSWQGYYGNVSGTLQLADSNNKALYNWSILTPYGEVYATRSFDANFATISCASSGEIASEESFMGQNSEDRDSISNTFNKNSHPSFFVGSTQIHGNNCSSANLYDEGGEQSSSFYEVLLEDGGSNIIYTAILERDKQGFDGNNYDFEMLVLENGHGNDTDTTTYYFYIEFG